MTMMSLRICSIHDHNVSAQFLQEGQNQCMTVSGQTMH